MHCRNRRVCFPLEHVFMLAKGGLLLVVAVASSSVWSKPTPVVVSDYVCENSPCELVVDADSGSNVLSWNRYTGDELDPFGYDVHYTATATPPAPEGEGRIQAGGGPPYTDPAAPARCGGYYHVRAYSRGHKRYTPALSAAAPSCGGGDTVAPVVSIVTPTEGALLGASQLFSGTASDDGGSGVASAAIEVFAAGSDPDTANPSIDAAASLSGSGWTYSAALPNGAYDLYASATDLAGNEAQRDGPRSFVVQIPTDDTVPPVLAVTSPTDADGPLDMPAVIEGTVTDEGGSGVPSVGLRIDDSNAATVLERVVAPQGESWSLGIDDLTDGDYFLYVDASDDAGNPALTVVQYFSVANIVQPIVIRDGYSDTAACGTRDGAMAAFALTPPSWRSEFDETGSDEDFHNLLAEKWKSRYEWRQPSTDVVTNNESQTYLDVLGYDAGFRGTWSPFKQLLANDNGYLAMRAAKSATVLPNGPVINDAPNGGQPYLSGILTTYDTLPLSPAPGQVITIELKARMPRGQGVFPAWWLYPRDFANGPRGYLRNDEIDVFEHIGQTPACDQNPATPAPACYSADETTSGWRLPSETCPSCPSWRQNSYYTQYHNYHTPVKGKLRSIASEAGGGAFGAVYTNPSPGTPWRGETWVGCAIDFSEKLHTYTLQWSADALVVFIDHIEVLRVDAAAEDEWLNGTNFVPISTDEMAMNLNFALGSADSFIGPPDAYTQGAMEEEVLMMVVDYVRIWY